MLKRVGGRELEPLVCDCCQPTAGASIPVVHRPEANFTSLEALVTRIHKDGDVSKEALSAPQLQQFASDSFLQPSAVGFDAAAGAGMDKSDATEAAQVDAADEVVEVAASG